MKKRILSLLVALCLIVGLLPVIAMAESGATADISFGDDKKNTTISVTKGGDPVYLKSVLVAATSDRTKIIDGAFDDYHIKLEYPANEETVYVYLNSVTICQSYTTNNIKGIMLGSTAENNDFNVNIVLTGTNNITIGGAATNTGVHSQANMACITSNLASGRTLTISSAEGQTGTLNLTSVNNKNYQKAFYSVNNVVFDNVNINAQITSTASSARPTIHVLGDLTVRGGSLTASHAKAISVLCLDESFSGAMSTGAGMYNLTIENGANVNIASNLASGAAQPVRVNGSCVIDNSDVAISYVSSNASRTIVSKPGNVTDSATYTRVDARNVTVEASTTSTYDNLQSYEPVVGDEYDGYSYLIYLDLDGDGASTDTIRSVKFTPVSGGGSGEGEEDEITISAAMDLGADLSYVAFVDPADVEGKTDLKAKITHTYADGRAADVQESALTYGQVQGENWYYASYEKLAAKEMMDELHIEIYAGEEKIAEDTQTVRSYIERTVDTVDADWQKAFAAILNYGAGAQALFTYNTGNPANGNLTGTLASVDLSGVTVPTGAHTVSGDYNGMRLAWENSIAAVMFVDGIEEGMTAKFTVGGQEYDPVEILDGGVNGTGFKCGNVAYKNLETDIVLTVYDAQGAAVAAYTDSMASYITRNPSVTGINAFAVMCVCVAAAQ